ncbi:formyltetrahydrofolate deformylase [Pontibacter ummariensis]|uniref:Formyltetrahydrofolate deformylase n=1 Tax=Pontibacter ummariensis TaxID=1610492 RepID=A0A239ESW5_9BACT|nr:formyltetrahydrofolate deformylase [Pontibacter ummariensis]PRY12765.1 formyltetrahydrofolate deformylase [Pontibacter ummariensis]SNS47679.1 formyltetrahydrofolate deformylase [Pontibacter ummariensis]
MLSNILLINCPDQRGLVFKVTSILYNKYALNVIRNDEFVERNFNHFFMRTEFSGEFDREELLKELYEVLPEDVEIKLTDKRKKDIVLLATKEHHCLSDLLIRHAFNELNANIRCVISNYDVLEELTKKFDVPFHFISHEGMSREAHEAAILQTVQQYTPEFVVLAKYMRILSGDFVSHFTNRIINIHHSFLPAFVGANPYAQAYERGVKIIGATAHFVNNDLDQGPIIAQSVIPVDHTHSAREMAQAGRDVEKNVLAKSLRLVLNEQVFVYRNKTILFE